MSWAFECLDKMLPFPSPLILEIRAVCCSCIVIDSAFLIMLSLDESEEVEALAQKVVGTIEHILGESIQQYF